MIPTTTLIHLESFAATMWRGNIVIYDLSEDLVFER